MKPHLDADGARRLAGVLGWGAAALPVALAWLDARHVTPALAGASVSLVAFLAAFMRGLGHRSGERFPILVLQTVAALTAALTGGTGFEGILLVMVAAQLVYALPPGPAIAWTVLQTALYGVPIALRFGTSSALVPVAAYFAFSVFAMYTSWMAEREASGREELARLNAELRATQELLGESSRLAERARISRDLHDLLGHHLTALSLSLEVAAHVAEGRAKEEVERSRALAKLLLSDVRDVVGRFRDDDGIDLPRALQVLATEIARPAVTITVDPALRFTDPAVAESLLRGVQEIVTNAVKHAAASRLTIALARDGDGLRLTASDDGRGAREPLPGGGLRSLRERAAELGGSLGVRTAPGAGFAVELVVPSLARRTA